MNHAASLGNSADTTVFPSDYKLIRRLLELCVGRHDSLAGKSAVFTEPRDKRRDSVLDRDDVERLPDNTRGRHNNIRRRDVQLMPEKLAHPGGNPDSVCIAGIRVTAVAENGMCKAVRNIFFRDCKRRSLNKIGRVNRRSRSSHLAVNQRQISF